MAAKLSLILIHLPLFVALLLISPAEAFFPAHETRKIGKHGYIDEESKMAMLRHPSPGCNCHSEGPNKEKNGYRLDCNCGSYKQIPGNRGGFYRGRPGRPGRNGK